MGLKALRDLRVFPETQVDLAERRARKDRSVLRVLSVTQVSRAIAASKDPKDRKALLGPKDPSVTQVSKAIPAHKALAAPRGLKDPKARQASRDPQA